MANDTPDWKNILQNEILSVIPGYVSVKTQITVANLAVNSDSSPIFCKLPLNYYDGAIFVITSANGLMSDYTFRLDQLRYDQTIPATWIGPQNNSTVILTFNSRQNDNAQASNISNYIQFDQQFVGDALVLYARNTSASVIANDTITITAVAKYSSDVVVNDNTNPVQTQGIHGNKGISGNLSLPSSTATAVPGTQNVIVTRLIVTPFNPNGAATNAADRIFVELDGAVGAAIPVPNLASNTFGNPVEFDFGEGISLGANGIQLNPNDNLAAYTIVVLK